MTYKIHRHDSAYRHLAGSGELTTTENGIVYGSLAKAAIEYGTLVKQHIPDAEQFSGGVFIYVPKDIACSLPFEIEYAFGEKQLTKTLILLGNGATASILTYVSGAGVGGFGFTVHEERKVFVGEGANYSFAELFHCNEEVGLNIAADIKMMSYSVMNGISTELCNGGDISLKYNTDLAGKDIECRHSTIFLVAGTENSSIDETVNHLTPDCHSDILVKGIASGTATGSFKGLVYVAQDAQRTRAYQQSRNILLSDAARIETSPQLEIYADDVKCSHGATVGYVNDDSLFYMRQRGLDELQARKLQLKGFVDDVLMRCNDEVWRKNAMALAESKIDNL